MSEMDKTLNSCEPHEDLILDDEPAATILAIFDTTADLLGDIVYALDGNLYIESQAKALADTAEAAVLFACETYKALEAADLAYELGYQDGAEDGYDEAVSDLIDEDDDDNFDYDPDFDDDVCFGIPTQVFHCTYCDRISDNVCLSSETGDKLCPICGSVVLPYDIDLVEEDEDQISIDDLRTELCCENCNQFIARDSAPDHLCPKCHGKLTEQTFTTPV